MSKNQNGSKFKSEVIKSTKKDLYPYNLLISTFEDSTYEEAHAKNLLIVLDSLSRRYKEVSITIDKYKNNISTRELAAKYQISSATINKSVKTTKSLITKYKDSLFNGFNNSKLCVELRKDFRNISIPEHIIKNLNRAGIYDLYSLKDMSSEEFVDKLSDNLDEIEASAIIEIIIPAMHDSGIDITNISKIDKKSKESNKVSSDRSIKTTNVYRIEPLVAFHYICPVCRKKAIAKYQIKFDNNKGNISVEDYHNKKVKCTSCGTTITLIRNRNIF